MTKPWNSRGWEPDWRKRRRQQEAELERIKDEQARCYNPWRSRPRTPLSNKYAGSCSHCGQRVESGAGWAFKRDGKWAVKHRECPELNDKTNEK